MKFLGMGVPELLIILVVDPSSGPKDLQKPVAPWARP